MTLPSRKRGQIKWDYVTALVLAAILIFLIVWFALDLQSLHRRGMMRLANRTNQRHIMAPEQIESWMTFRYVNFIFRLPPNYLEGALHISDPNYTDLTLSQYASAHNLNEATFLESVRQAVIAASAGGSQ